MNSMNRYLVLFIGMIGLACYGLGIFSAFALHRLSYDEGRLHSSMEWARSVTEIEDMLKKDGKCIVGDYRLVVDKKHKVVRVGKR